MLRYESSITRATIVHEAICAFLKAEGSSEKCAWKHKHVYQEMLGGHSNYCDEPDFKSSQQNSLRFRAFLSIRREMFWNLPPDTTWTRLENVTVGKEEESKITCLYPKAKAELTCYQAKKLDLNGLWLWTDNDKEYFVMEGNHRVSQWKHDGCNTMTIGSIFVLRSERGMAFPLLTHCLDQKVKTLTFASSGPNHWSVLYDNHLNPDASIWITVGLMISNLAPYIFRLKQYLASACGKR